MKNPYLRIEVRDSHYGSRDEFGFSLIEVMISIVLVAILFGIAVPTLQQLITNNTIRRGIDDLTNGFITARASAITSGAPVTICALNGDACSTTANYWAQGWGVFQDCDGDNTIDSIQTPCENNTMEPVFARSSGNTATWVIKGDNNSDGPTIFTFRSNGMITSAASWPVRFEIGSPDGLHKNTLYIRQSGQICAEIRDSGNCT